ncbi:hypothetical protein FH972_025495 [Carpinus fangiana]|uniref:Metallo-beta-lactamase domain-containing protein n=1 Tax=Carpinus fangiana TaxID=176857 RepID=A0A5N6L1T2_9ROSI|nr:hypothetical protein FH972_025495 [Carpinus fangiana]
MSLRVKSLNADSSFLLIFSPPAAAHDPQGTFPGSFTILIDPWLSGPSTVVHPKFAHTTHTVPSCVESLDALPDPDVVLISQDQPDHCHRQTLLTLPSDSRANIFAIAPAARKIRSWKHFDPQRVHSMTRFDERHPQKSIINISIPAYSHAGQPGQVTIAFLQPKRDITGLHNAVGITYRPPSSSLSNRNTSYLELAPLSPPTTPPALEGGHERYSYTNFGNLSHRDSTDGLSSPPMTPPSISTVSTTSLGGTLPLTPTTNTISAPFYADITSHCRERALSVIYSPHGLPYSLIKPYATSHLLPQSALPLTALFHCLDRVDNPWYLGGRIVDGGEAGAEIAKALNARVWVSAHDEEKQTSGWSVSRMKCVKMDVEDARALLRRSSDVKISKTANSTRVVELDSGEELLLKG